jgi:hypothetical protein
LISAWWLLPAWLSGVYVGRLVEYWTLQQEQKKGW